MNANDFLTFDWKTDRRCHEDGRGLIFDKVAKTHAKAGGYGHTPMSPVHHAWTHQGEDTPAACRLFIYEITDRMGEKPFCLVPLGFVDCSKFRGVYDWKFRDGVRDLTAMLVGQNVELWVAKVLAR